MLIEVIAENSEVKEIRNKEREIVALKQEVYAHLGGAFPVRCFIRIDDKLSSGKYQITLPMKIGKFGDIEVNPFETPEIRPARPEQVKQHSTRTA